MTEFIRSFIFGRCIARCKREDGEKFIDLIRESGISVSSVKYSGEEYSAVFAESRKKAFEKAIRIAGIDCTVERLTGIPKIVGKYKRRPGIILGVLVFLVVVLLSERVIWDFEITGNKNVSDIEIISALEKRGCKAGAFYGNMDFSLVQNDCLIDAEDLAWISVNMDGNLARVEVREKRVLPVDKLPEKGRFANIVAAEDGVVELCYVKNGKAQVEPGEVVKKGELLISGVIDVGEEDVRYEYADGQVIAKVFREIESYVPYKNTFESPTGRKKTEIRLKIFGKTINLSPRGRIDYELYGKIVESEKLSLPFGITLPMWVMRTTCSEMHVETKKLSESEALILAKEDAQRKLTKMADSLQIISTDVKHTADKSGVTVTLGVYGVTDISANYGFSVSENDTDKKEDTYTNEKNDNG